jgi:hypothetical protein
MQYAYLLIFIVPVFLITLWSIATKQWKGIIFLIGTFSPVIYLIISVPFSKNGSIQDAGYGFILIPFSLLASLPILFMRENSDPRRKERD